MMENLRITSFTTVTHLRVIGQEGRESTAQRPQLWSLRQKHKLREKHQTEHKVTYRKVCLVQLTKVETLLLFLCFTLRQFVKLKSFEILSLLVVVKCYSVKLPVIVVGTEEETGIYGRKISCKNQRKIGCQFLIIKPRNKYL